MTKKFKDWGLLQTDIKMKWEICDFQMFNEHLL